MAETYFPDAEFIAASKGRPIPPHVWETRHLFRRELDPVRADYGQPLLITSFYRYSGTHSTGAVDVQPKYGGEDTIRALADYIAWRVQPGIGRPIGKVIYEGPEPGQNRGHVHIAIDPGASGGYWEDPAGVQKYTRAEVPVSPPDLRSLAGLLVLLAGALAVTLGRGV